MDSVDLTESPVKHVEDKQHKGSKNIDSSDTDKANVFTETNDKIKESTIYFLMTKMKINK